MTVSAETFLANLKDFTSSTQDLDAESKREIHNLAKKLMFQTESERQTRERLLYAALATDIAQIAVDLKIFRTLAADPEVVWTVEELGQKCGADALLLHRLFRMLAVEGYVSEGSSPGSFQASLQTVALANDGFEAGLNHNRKDVRPAMTALPSFLRSTAYANPITQSHTAFHTVNEGKSIFDVMATEPERTAAVFQYMAAQRDGLKSWVEDPSFLIDFTLPAGEEGKRPLFVDVGGGSGHQCLALREHAPSLQPYQLVVQDTELMISQIDPALTACQNVTPLAHDFFAPQPLSTRGAKIYYLRNVLHDWPDEYAAKILLPLVDAMAQDSVIILDESIVSPTGADLRQCAKDMVMMSCCAAFERTLQQWKGLVEKVGLDIRDVWCYEPVVDEYLIVCVKK